MLIGRRVRASWLVVPFVLVARQASAQEEATPPEPVEASPPAPVEAPPAPVEAPPAPPASPAPRFGDAGEVVISTDASIALSSTRYSVGDGKFVDVLVSPAFDYFVIRGLSIGVDLTLAYNYTSRQAGDGTLTETTTKTIGGGPRLGLNLPLGESFSFYPRLTVGLQSSETERTTAANAPAIGPSGQVSVFNPFMPASVVTTSVTNGFVVVFAPLLFHPAPHFFLGAGPGMFKEFGATSSETERTAFFGRLVLGGWFGGPAEQAAPTAEPSPEAATPRPPPPRFGERGTWAFSGELGAGIMRTTYEGSDRTRTSYSVRPAADYFIVNHFSVGLAAVATRSSESSTPTAVTVEQATTTLGAAAVLGFDQPLASWLSVYPRASLGFARTSFDTTTTLDVTNSALTSVTVALYVPLLVHVASHAFVGFGPSLSHDLTNRYDNSDTNILRTTLGGHLIVGGWL